MWLEYFLTKVNPNSNNAYTSRGISGTIDIFIKECAISLSTNKLTIVHVKLIALPSKSLSFPTSSDTALLCCVIKTATAEITFSMA